MKKLFFAKILSFGAIALVGLALALPASAKGMAKNPCAGAPANPCAPSGKTMGEHKGKDQGKHKGEKKAANPCAGKPANAGTMKQ